MVFAKYGLNGGDTPIAQLTYDEIRQFEAGSWFADSFAGIKIPTLEEALEVVIQHGMGLNLEIKPCPVREKETAEVSGRIHVIGHNDSVPEQSSNPFRSNQGLSEDRAATIAKLLVAAGLPADQVVSEGRADTEPVGDNATKEGRAQNRRIEIKIEKRL